MLEVKYVDDGINAEVINMKEVPLMLIGDEKYKETTAPKPPLLAQPLKSPYTLQQHHT